MNTLNIVQDALIDILAELHGKELDSTESLAALVALIAAMGADANEVDGGGALV